MGFFKKAKKIGSFIVDVRVDRWIGFEFLKNTAHQLYCSTKALTTPDQATRTETFEEAIIRLNLTEKVLQSRKKSFTQLFYTYLSVSMIVFIYSVYITTLDNFLGFLIGISLTIFGLSQAFKYHFWLFQIRHRKLGCTIKEWFSL